MALHVLLAIIASTNIFGRFHASAEGFALHAIKKSSKRLLDL